MSTGETHATAVLPASQSGSLKKTLGHTLASGAASGPLHGGHGGCPQKRCLTTADGGASDVITGDTRDGRTPRVPASVAHKDFGPYSRIWRGPGSPPRWARWLPAKEMFAQGGWTRIGCPLWRHTRRPYSPRPGVGFSQRLWAILSHLARPGMPSTVGTVAARKRDV